MTFGATPVLCGVNDKTLDGVADWVDGFFLAAYGGLTVLLAVIVRGETLQPLQGLGAALGTQQAAALLPATLPRAAAPASRSRLNRSKKTAALPKNGS